MKAAKLAILTALIGTMLASSGCAQLMGALRRDLDDGDSYADAPPTTGGRWAEHGFLSQDLPEGGSVGDKYVGHTERDPASGSNRSWRRAASRASEVRAACSSSTPASTFDRSRMSLMSVSRSLPAE